MTSRFFLVILFSFYLNAVSSQEKWGLQQAVDYAWTNNITVKQALSQARLSRITADRAKLSVYPTLAGSISGSYQHGLNENPTTGTLESANFISGSIGAQSQYSIFNWGARKNNIASAQLYAEADELGISKAQNDIALLVANAYLQVMLRMEQVKITEAAVSLSQARLVNTRKLVDAGSQPELNAIQQEAQLVRDSSALLQAQSLVQEGLFTLKSYLNFDIEAPFGINAPKVEDIAIEDLLSLQPAEVYNIALQRQPVQKQYALRIQASQKDVLAARANMFPSLSAFAALNSRYINSKFPYLLGVQTNQPTGAFVLDQGGNKISVLADRPLFGERAQGIFRQLNTNFGQNVGLNIQLPIFNGGQLRAQWKRAIENVNQTRLLDEQEKLNLKSNIYTAYQQAFSSLQKFRASLRNVEVLQKALDIATKRSEIGLLGTLDYIITQNNLTSAQIEAVSNRYDYVFKVKVLEFYKGKGLKL